MPQDRYLPVTDLKFDQVVALGHGHVRYESGVTKYYTPGVQIVYSWQSPDILSTPKDFYYGYQGFYDSAVSPLAGLSGASFPFGSTSNNLTGAGAKRVSQQVDLNGSESSAGDYFVTTAGTLMKVGVLVRARSSGHSSLSTNDSSLPALRASAATIYSMFFMTTGLRALNSGVTVQSVASASVFPVTAGYFAAAPSTLTFSAAQNVSNALVVTVPFRSAASSSNAPGLLLSWSQPSGPDQVVTNVYRVSVISGGVDVASTFLSTSNIVTVGAGGFVGSIAAASIPTSGSYTVRVEEKIPAIHASLPSGNYVLDTYAVCCQGVSTVSVSSTMTLTGLDTAVVTGGGAVTGGGEASVSNVFLTTAVNELSTDWAIQDLQINLRTRAVTSSLTTIKIKPNDTAIIGLLFHNGTYVVDPGVTNLKFAARDSANSGAYTIYDTDTTVVSVGDANYYKIEVLANDSDLLDKQNANLLAGSNSAQSLLGEIQWTTTRGTFSSDTFTINVPSEVVREPDV